MKNTIVTLVFSFCSLVLFAQHKTIKPKITLETQEYHDAKLAGIVDQYEILSAPSQVFDFSFDTNLDENGKKKKGGGANITVPPKASGCNCYKVPDSTYVLAVAPGDDGSSAPIPIPFPFCFYGDTMTTMFININGNVSFGSASGAFSSSSFPSLSGSPAVNGANTVTIAPFWGDVDTRGGNGQILYKVTPTAIYINWEEVGYYNQHGDKTNTFQLILTDGLDVAIDGGNVAFCYGDMQWTTGDASPFGNVGGFGGIPATAGANKGDSISYFLVSRFNQPGTLFDGALGNPDGISWLDYKSFFFDVCSNALNVPPVPSGASSCDTFKICSIGDTADIQFIFLSPEATQSTSIVVSSPTLPNLQIVSNVPGNTAYTVLRVPGTAASVGTHVVQITATDNFVPPGITVLDLTVIIDSLGTSNFNPTLSPISGCDSVLVDVLGGGYDSYLWDNLLLDTAIYVTSALQNFGVTVERNGCFKRIDTNFLVAPSFNINLIGNNTLCSAVPNSFYQLPDSLNYGTVSWGLANPALDTLFSNTFLPGNYVVTVTDTLGVCTKNQAFSIVQLPPLVVPVDDSICGSSYNLIVSGGSGSGSWASVGPVPPSGLIASSPTNTLATFSATGIYTLVYTDNVCSESDTVVLVISRPIPANFIVGSQFYCPGQNGSPYTFPDSIRFGTNIIWSTNPAWNGTFANSLTAGTYSVTVTDTLGLCSRTSNFVVGTQADIVLMPDTATCGNSVTMTSNTAGGFANSGTWSLASGPGSPQYQFSNQTLNQTLTFTAGYGVYTMVYTAANCPNNDTLVITLNPPPAINFNNPDFFVCPETLEFIALVDSAMFTAVDWGIANPGLNALYSSNLSLGTYTVTVTDLNGCISDSTFTIISQIPVALLPNPNTCGDSLGLSGNTGIDGGLWTLVSGPGTATFFPATSLQTSVKWSKPGVYTLVYTEPICQDDDTLVIDVEFFPYSEVGNELGCIGLPQTVTAFSVWENITSYLWSNGQTGLSAILTEPGYYFLESTNSCGTHIWDFYYDARACDIDMPNVFTPNGDGQNAFFLPVNANGSGFTTFDMKLFNRWGNLMFQTNDINKGWDGRSAGGQAAEDGVYFYVVEAKDVEGQELKKQGFFHLVSE